MIKVGVPHSLRPHIWLRVSGALDKKKKSETSYKDIVKASSNDHLMTSKQIEKVSVDKSFKLFHSYLQHLNDVVFQNVYMNHSYVNLQDLLRTMPSNACFCNINSTGVPRLRRVLRGLAWLYPDIGYCQGTGMVNNILNISLMLISKRMGKIRQCFFGSTHPRPMLTS